MRQTRMRLAIVSLLIVVGTLVLTSVAGGTQPAEDVGAARPCGILEEPETLIVEEPQALTAAPGSLRQPTTTLGDQGEPSTGVEENGCMPAAETTKTSGTPTTEVGSAKPPAKITVKSRAGSQSANPADTAEAAAGAGTVAVAWGDNYPAGQLGAGYKDAFETAPVLVRELSEINSMVAAGETSYALLDKGVVRAWGSPGQDDLGNDEPMRKSPTSPVAVLEETSDGEVREMTDVTAIAGAVGASRHGMAVVNEGRNENDVMTWGASAFGERGNGEYDGVSEGHAIKSRDLAIAVPALEHQRIVAIAAGGDSDYALQEEGVRTTVWAWGGNKYGKLGTGSEGGKTCKGDGAAKQGCVATPQRVDLSALPPGVKVRGISAGRRAAYAVLTDGRVLAWGENAYGQLGDGTTTNSDVPTYVCARGHAGPCSHGPYLEGVKTVSGGELFALALLEDGEVVGWGVNATGNVGGESHEACKNEGLTFCQRTPKRVEGLREVRAISAGSEYGLALVSDGEHPGQVYAWGSNEHGQLGDGEPTGPETCGERNVHRGGNVETIERQCSRKPLPISGLSDASGISASDGADPYNGSYGHSFAYLRSAEAPAPLLSVTPEEKQGRQTLQVNWSVTSTPESDYKIKWKQTPPASNPNMIKVEELGTEAEEALATAGEWDEAAEEAEEREDSKTAKKDLEKQEEYRGKARVLTEEQKQYEEAAEGEYPSSEIAKVTKTCSGFSKEWCETITEVHDGKDQSTPLSTETSYQITLNVNGSGNGDYAMRVVATTLP
jgi:alpha-tubulin suppressor-like RCC1 family protein